MYTYIKRELTNTEKPGTINFWNSPWFTLEASALRFSAFHKFEESGQCLAHKVCSVTNLHVLKGEKKLWIWALKGKSECLPWGPKTLSVPNKWWWGNASPGRMWAEPPHPAPCLPPSWSSHSYETLGLAKQSRYVNLWLAFLVISCARESRVRTLVSFTGGFW
jgi:hypothetical protein